MPADYIPARFPERRNYHTVVREEERKGNTSSPGDPGPTQLFSATAKVTPRAMQAKQPQTRDVRDCIAQDNVHNGVLIQ